MNINKVNEILNKIMEFELAGVVRYTHSSLMVTGPYRLPIVEFLKEQANESLMHAQQAGELLTGLDGHPSQKIANIYETNDHSIKGILEESLTHEIHALNLYKDLLGDGLISLTLAKSLANEGIYVDLIYFLFLVFHRVLSQEDQDHISNLY